MDSNNNTVEKPRPDNFDGYLKTLDLNDVKAKDQVAYYTVLSKAIEHLSGLNYKEDGLSKKYFLQYEIIKNSSYADYAMAHILKHFINYNYQDSKPTIDSLFEHYKSKFNNKLYLDNLATSHESANNILKGKPAPAIDLMDEFGNNFSLNQLLGSYVYVDFWATWCGPCISSMKHAPPIIEEYNPKNIKFLYVNCWDSKAQWETYLKKDTKLNGIHVFANEEQTKALRKKYNFNGIPRYIIIGKQGEIIDSEAERPNKIKPVFDELLKGGK
jgi:thiol-disulfide isomerase/thioredoxin